MPRWSIRGVFLLGRRLFFMPLIHQWAQQAGYAGAGAYLMVVIAREIGSGVVPMDAGERAWRERHGRLLRRLAQQAGSVRRVFCGLTEVLK